jgi:hypothetical protein
MNNPNAPGLLDPVSMLDCLRDQLMLGLISRSADQIERYSEMLPHKRFMFVSGKETLWINGVPGLG